MWSRFIVLLFAVVLTLFAIPARSQPVDLLITGGTIVTMDQSRQVLKGGAIAIRRDRIDGVYAASEPLPEARTTIDASGQLVIPGLVNTHGHAAMTLLRGIADDLSLLEWLEEYMFPAEAKNVSPEFVYWGTLLASLEMVRGGTTTFTDMYFFQEEAARAVEAVGNRAVLGQVVIGFPAPDYETPEQALVAAEKFIEQYRGHPLVVPSVAPHGLYTTPLDVVARAHALARRNNVPFQIHAAETEEEEERVRNALGKTTIPALGEAGLLTPGTVLHHAIWLSDDDIDMVARSGAAVSHNPESNMKLASGLAPVPTLLAAGVPAGLGTDGAASNNNLDLFEEMDAAAKIHKLISGDPTIMPAKRVFEMATLGGASALGLSDRIGSIEPNKLADIVLVDLDVPELTPLYDVYSHLVYAIKAAHVDTVIINGNMILRDRQILTVDTNEVLGMATAFKKKVVESLAAD